MGNGPIGIKPVTPDKIGPETAFGGVIVPLPEIIVKNRLIRSIDMFKF